MRPVYLLTLRQLSGKWRLFIMTVLAALPVLVSAIMLASKDAPSVRNFESTVMSGMLIGAITPLVVLAIAAAAFSIELEDRTLANLTLSPIARWQIVVPKLLGSITLAAPFIAASALATSYIAYLGDMTAVLAVAVAAVAAVALYAAAFIWLGLLTTQAIGLGLLYIVLWEGFFARYVAGVRLLSVRYHAIALMHGLDERRFAHAQHLDLGVTVLIAVLVFSAFVGFAVRRLRRMDVP